jgi:DNA-binding LacI/PurR family transcriptional regulator
MIAMTPDLLARDRALRELRQWITTGRVAAGEFLPAERQLTTALDLPRTAIRHALTTLEHEGLLHAQGRRRMVRARPGNGGLLGGALVVLSDVGEQCGADPYAAGATTGITLGALAAADGDAGRVCDAVVGWYRGTMTMTDADRLIAAGVRGVVIVPTHQSTETVLAITERLRTAQIAVAVYADPHLITNVDTVWADHYAGARLLVEHAIANGLRRVMPVWRDDGSRRWPQERECGIHDALRAAGLATIPRFAPVTSLEDPKDEAGFQATAAALAGELASVLTSDEPPEVLIALSDVPATLLAAAVQRFRHFPTPPLIFGYDANGRYHPTTMWAGRSPDLTVDKDNAAIGRTLVRLVLERLAGTAPAGPVQVLVAPHLVVPSLEFST